MKAAILGAIYFEHSAQQMQKIHNYEFSFKVRQRALIILTVFPLKVKAARLSTTQA